MKMKKLQKQNVIRKFKELGACESALGWLQEQSGSVKTIYVNCDDKAWLEWLYQNIGLRADCEAIRDAAFADYEAIRDPALADYEAICKLPWLIVRIALLRLLEQ